MKKLTADALRHRRMVTIADLISKTEAEDWHGVADAAMDLRELDAQLEVLHISGSFQMVPFNPPRETT